MLSSISKRLPASGGQNILTYLKRIKSAVLALLFVSFQVLSPLPAVIHAAPLERERPSNQTSFTNSVSSPTPATNPSLSEACGLDIALAIDNSNSISSTEMSTMKTALKGFTNALAGTPTQFSVTRFGTDASVVHSFTASVTDTNAAIDSVTTGGGGTNWEDGLLKTNSTFDPRTDKPNLVIFASDGNPTYHNGGGNGFSTSQADIDAAITQANVIKNSGTRMLALGIGNGLDIDNLKAISGPNANTGNVLTSDVITTDFSNLSTQLATFANQTCGGTITTTKLIDQDGNLNTTNDQVPSANWTFDINGSPSNPSPTSTDANGQTPAVKVDAGTYSVNETQQAGYSLLSASCTGASQNGSRQGDAVTGLQVVASNIVSCTFINSPKPTLRLVKTVVNDNGGTKSESDFQGKIDGTNVDWNTAVTLSEGSHSASEVNLPGYQAGNWGGDCNADGSITLTAGQIAVCTITNNDIPPGITVNKVASNPYGNALPASSFPLYVDATGVTSGALNNQFNAGSHTISETQQTGYAFTNVTGDCTLNNDVISVILDLGKNYVCTITNTAVQPKLIVVKHVINDNSGTKSASDFTMKVSGNSQSVADFPGNENGTEIGLNEGSYSVDEIADAGYNKTFSGDCSGTITIGETKTCTITNNDVPHPEIKAEKYGPDTAFEGDTVSYTFIVTNPGDTPLTNVSVTDDIAGAATYQSGDSNHNDKLDTDETWFFYAEYTISIPQTDDVVNTVTACAQPSQVTISAVNNNVCDDDNHTLDVLHPAIQVVKSGPATAQPGDTVTYTFTVTNTGDAALSGVSVDDSLIFSVVYQSGDTNADDMLDVDETWIYTAEFTVPVNQVDDVVNTATACGYLPGVEEDLGNYELKSVIRPQISLPRTPMYCDQDDHTLKVVQPAAVTPASTTLAPSGISRQPYLLAAIAALTMSGSLAALWITHKRSLSK